MPGALKLKKLYAEWLAATEPDEHARIWHEMLSIWADEVYSIGTVAGVLQPILVSDRLRNVPTDGIWNWNPGAHFGIYKPDGFWFDTGEPPRPSAELTPSPR
jgi:peptide/nickel transport system substrate-binding protein